MEKDLWKQRIAEFPAWPCPTCKRGQLLVVPNSLVNKETERSRSCHQLDEWEPEWIESRFTVHLQCSDIRCGEGAVVAGKSGCDLHRFYNEEGQSDSEVNDIFYPQFMYPAPFVIHIPDETPSKIKEEINNATALIWLDDSSCANKIRLTIERILSALKVRKTTINKNGKQIRLTLDSRINKLPPERKEIADLLHSMRHLGNQASHETLDGIARNDLLNTFEVLEHVLELAFSKKVAGLKKAAKEITKRKGRPKGVRKSEFGI